VSVRPIRSDDAPGLAAAVEQLSEPSRYRRFHSAMPRLSEQMVGYLTDVDHHDHEALIATAPGSTKIVGVARFIRDTDNPDTAELAILVVDVWQRRGLGTLLLSELTRRAAHVGISHFTAEILSENTPDARAGAAVR
jgi:RimJ/RimL family protein N-acetyltransferase